MSKIYSVELLYLDDDLSNENFKYELNRLFKHSEDLVALKVISSKSVHCGECKNFNSYNKKCKEWDEKVDYESNACGTFEFNR